MRTRVFLLVAAFSVSTDAIEAEAYFQEHGIEGRMIPLPGSISAGCGLAWSASLEQRPILENLIQEQKIKVQGIYEIQLFERKERGNV